MLRNAAKGVAKTVTELSQYPTPGEKLNGFTLLRSKHVPELELTALHLQHDKTGAHHLHIARDDANNVFSIGFKTNPPDDTGVPHILEHTTLCGSEKYPIRDPFFKMLPRTLSNFMNAFTAADHTFYPFATTNSQDFKNLMSVYLDATLHPLLKKTDFLQEGWRVGPENPQAMVSGSAKPEDEKLVFKGVVYNEMKGQMSDAAYLFYIRFQDHIFPAINNSGGDPSKITELTYEKLKSFQSQHYHPSNAKVLTYGDMPLADHLQEINEQFSRFDRISVDQENKLPVDLGSGPKLVVEYGPEDPLADAERQFKTSVSWVVGDTSDVVESFSLSLISALLTDGYGSPLYVALIESGLGTDWSPNTGYDGSDKMGIFSVGLSGVKEAEVEKVKDEVMKVLHTMRNTGFDQSKLDGYLHQLEISLKHKTANFGMSIMRRLKPKWFNGTDPFDSLAWNETVSEFKKRLATGTYLQELMDKYMLNDNTLIFTMRPSPDFAKKLVKDEESRLATKIAYETENEGSEAGAKKHFEQQELELLAEQGKTMTEDLECLPTVHVKDIPRSKPPTVLQYNKVGGSKVQWHEAPTNGLTYFRAINPLENIPSELRSLIPLFTDAIMRLGTKDMTMEQLEDLMKLKTGGVSIAYHLTSSPINTTETSEGIGFGGMALDCNVPFIFDLIRKLVSETNFDGPQTAPRIRQLLQASADGVVNSIASSGHSYARRYAESGLSKTAALQEQVSGLTQVKLITSLAGRPETDGLSDIISKLKEIQRFALAGNNMRAAVTCGAESVSENTAQLEKFLSSRPHPSGSCSLSGEHLQKPRRPKTFFPLPYQVYYGSLAVPTVSYIHPDGAPLQILSQLLTHRHLHHEIREKGGAYGGGAYSRAIDGVFGFYSYRDPSPVNTLGIMRNAGRWAMERKWTPRDMEEAKISVFQSVDAPRSVNEEGMGRFLSGVTDEMKQTRREQLLDVTSEQVRDVAERYVAKPVEEGQESVAFLGGKQSWVDSEWDVQEMNIKAPPE
ncbi:hypothetical protein MKZ38_008373 [Zalerion maritima]|uniref:Presequence protease, mitochondrial n=1 Tax=Zalerion maritima TaxID=339359 RepID=A0AAD5S2H6_9PEZI|nr:hypothetical protein MKZ38_008373 [Zalerion maritima]